jgi:hypothetical protein
LLESLHSLPSLPSGSYVELDPQWMTPVPLVSSEKPKTAMKPKGRKTLVSLLKLTLVAMLLLLLIGCGRRVEVREPKPCLIPPAPQLPELEGQVVEIGELPYVALTVPSANAIADYFEATMARSNLIAACPYVKNWDRVREVTGPTLKEGD